MKKRHLLPGLIVALILMLVFYCKHIFPFGNDFISWGDMHAQILALYYNFYDIFYNGKSFLVDFTNGTASNLISNFSYYIISPFTFIILLFQRSDIPQAVSLIVLFKIVLSAITCNCFLDKKFEKLNNFYKIFFSILYALSTYNLSLYIITGWIDIVYLFPLLMIGLDKILNDKKPTMFIIVLSISLLFNFYISLMCIVFIFFATLIYILFFNINNKKQKITLLGISIFLSLLISSVLLLPTLIQIISSARMGFNFTQLFDSKTGPLIDKFMFLISSMAMLACTMIMLKTYKVNKKPIIFFLLLFLIVGISLVVEPINKIWHFGSYVSYPYRYGFILNFLLITSSCFYLCQKKQCKKNHNILIYLTTIVCNAIIIILAYRYYNILQTSVDQLSFSFNHYSFLIMIIIAFLNFISYFIIFLFNNKDSKHTYICLMINLILFSLVQSFIYIKIDFDEQNLHSSYDNMNYIYNMDLDDSYHFKQENSGFIENYGSIINKPSQDYFTSLTDNSMFLIYQKLGYDSYWMNTSSRGSNYFVDFLLSNKFLVTKDLIDNDLYKLNNKKDDLLLYETTLPVSKGYIIKENKSILNTNNSFDATNILYSSVTGKKANIFDIISDFNLANLNFKDNYIEIIDKNKEAYFEKEITITDKKTLYFEVQNSYLSLEKNKIYHMFDIYINNELIIENYPNKEKNNCINLGSYENSTIKLKVKVKKDAKVSSIKLGLLNHEKLQSYFNNNFNNIKIIYDKNKLKINYTSTKEDLLFIPTIYLNGMKAKNNDKDIEIIKVFDNFIGIKLNSGENNIVISYIPPGLKVGSILSLIGIILTILFVILKNKVCSSKILNNIFYNLYLIMYFVLTLVVYILPLIIFIVSYF